MSHAVAKKNLLDAGVQAEIETRLAALSAVTPAKWGRMSAAQMLAHCAEVQDVANGKDLSHTPFVIRLFASFIRRAVTSLKPYPTGVRTHPQYVVDEDVDFDAARERLLASIHAMHEKLDGVNFVQHPLFGRMTREDAGWAMYKHLDHHLRQFGV